MGGGVVQGKNDVKSEVPGRKSGGREGTDGRGGILSVHRKVSSDGHEEEKKLNDWNFN